MELTEHEAKIYEDGRRHAVREMKEGIVSLMDELAKKRDLEERIVIAHTWADNLCRMMMRIVHSGLNEKRKSQAGDLVHRARLALGFKAGSILRSERHGAGYIQADAKEEAK